MTNQSIQNLFDALDAFDEVRRYIDQDEELIIVRKGDVEIRIDSTRHKKRKEGGADNGK